MNYVFKLFFPLLIAVSTLNISCSKDDTETPPPTIDNIVNTYSGTNLKLTMDGKPAAENAEIKLIKNADNSLSIELTNVVTNLPKFTIPNATFAAETKASFVSKVTGEASDLMEGVKVTANGVVDATVLTMQITTAEIVAEPAMDAKSLYGPYKVDMAIDVAGTPQNPLKGQFVYLAAAGSWSTPGAPSDVKLKINNFAFEGMNLGNIVLDMIPVTKRGNIYFLKAADQTITLAAPIGEVKADLDGHIVDGVLNLKLTITCGEALGNLQVIVDISGETIVATGKIAIDSDVVVDQPAQALKLSDEYYRFTVLASTPAEKLILTPTIETPKGATLKVIKLDGKAPETPLTLTSPIDFSKVSKASYEFTAEDNNTKITIDLKIVKIEDKLSPKFTFDTWETVGADKDPKKNYEMPVPQNIYGSSNPGVSMLILFGADLEFPVQKTTDAKAGGAAAKLVSLNTEGLMGGLAPALTAGSLFTGAFETVFPEVLNSTQFGIAFMKKPLRFKGYYKYKAGEKYMDGTAKPAVEIPGKKDLCAINVVLYEVSHYAETLTGKDINTSSKIAAVASGTDGSEKAEYTAFDVEFNWVNGKTYSADKKYKLAVICSSSKDGDFFKGAPGSTLFVDELEVVTEII